MLIAAFIISKSRAESKFMTLKPLYFIALYSQTAFDVVSHKILLDKLYESGIHPSLWTIVKDLYTGMSPKIKWMGEISQKFPINQGVRQSAVLSTHDCKLDLVTIQGNLTGEQCISDVLYPVVAPPHFDNHPLATRPVYMDDNVRPHRTRAITAYLQREAVTYVPWPAMSPDLNPIERIWDILCRHILAREHPLQNIRQLEAALHREWQQLSQEDIRRLTGGMGCSV